MPELVLYYRPTCPYCQKVLAFMQSRGLELTMKNISQDPQFAEELISAGGKRQVPCLFIDGVAMYESDDIVDWLKENAIQN